MANPATRTIRSLLHTLGVDVVRHVPGPLLPPDFDEGLVRIWRAVQPFTMTSPERIACLVDAVRYVVAHDIGGAFVECGVWKGGSSMAMMLALRDLGAGERDIYLYDTFSGMSAPGEEDVSFRGESAEERFQRTRIGEDASDWCRSPIDEVRTNLRGTGYDEGRIRLVEGKVEDTIPGTLPGPIAILRLDTDWYESTRHELHHLYPRLVPGGVLIIDDYGHWQGAQKAVDEYFAEKEVRMLLNRIDYTGRVGIKT